MQNTLNNIRKSLESYYPKGEISMISRLILEHVTNTSYPILLLNKDTQITDHQTNEISAIIERLQNHEPIQHITGNTEFYGLSFKVNKNVLIPRQETEELVDLILNDNKAKQTNSILDIGTGSGCIAISLKKNMPLADVYAWDISKNALSTAKENSQANNTEVTFMQVDVLDSYPTTTMFDVIVSNPPYILEEEKVEMEQHVLDFEPHNALFVPNNKPLLFYERIADLAHDILKDKGELYFEINRAMGLQTVAMLKDKDFSNIQLIKDISNNDRIVKAQLIRK